MEDVSMEYIDKVKEQLSKMSEYEKDKWILTQAKLKSENKQKDFLQSLSGEKKIMDHDSDGCEQDQSILEENWEYLNEIARQLEYEGVDDQPGIDTMFDICDEILEMKKIEQINWELRRKILGDIITHDYYDIFGCYDIMQLVADKLCTNQEEYLGYADLLDATYVYKEKAAYLYHQYGNDDKYISYLENYLGKACKEYNALITYYKEHDQEEDAKRIALQGLENCKDDLTEIFIFLLLDAEKQNDKKQFDKLYASAKRRKYVDIMKINQELKAKKQSCENKKGYD